MQLILIVPDILESHDALRGMEVTALATAFGTCFDELLVLGPNSGVADRFTAVFAGLGGRVTWITGEGRSREVDAADAVLCYPGGISTWHALFGLLTPSVEHANRPRPPVYLYSWEKFYAPFILQIHTALARGLMTEQGVSSIIPFESIEALLSLLGGMQRGG